SAPSGAQARVTSTVRSPLVVAIFTLNLSGVDSFASAGLRSAGTMEGSAQLLPFKMHFCCVLHASDCLQSASDPTTQAPSLAVQKPLVLHTAVFAQSSDVATTHLPSRAVHSP